MVTETSQVATILRRIADLEVGWHLGNDVAWSTAGDDADERKDVLKVLDQLYLDGSLSRMYVYSRGRPQAAYLLDSNLRELADGVAS
jgi:hypothetical protein